MGHYASEMPSMDEMRASWARVRKSRDEAIYARLRFHRNQLVRDAKDRGEYGQIRRWLGDGLTYEQIIANLDPEAGPS